jgi:hypothetical protein
MSPVRLPCGDVRHLLAHKRCQNLPAFVPEEGPDEAEGGDDLIGIETLAFAVGRPFFFWFELDRLPLAVYQDFPDRFFA